MLLVSGKWFNSGTIRQSALAVIGKNRWYSGVLAVWDEGLRRGKTPTMLHTHEVTGSSPVVSTMRRVAAYIEDLCNGSTPDSDSVCGGSNPSSSAKKYGYPFGYPYFFVLEGFEPI